MKNVTITKGHFGYPIKRGAGWVKIVEGIDPGGSNGFAVLGPFIKWKKDATDVPVGALLLGCEKDHGGDSNGNMFRLYRVNDDATLTPLAHYRGRGWFPVIRSAAVEAFGGGYGRARTPQDAGGSSSYSRPRPPSAHSDNPTALNQALREVEELREKFRAAEARAEALEEITRPAMIALRVAIDTEQWAEGTDDEPVWFTAAKQVYEGLFAHHHPELQNDTNTAQ